MTGDTVKNIIATNPYRRLECESGLPLQDLPDLVLPGDVLVLAPRHNTGSRHDATGAFHPGAIAFCDVHGLDREQSIYYFDNRKHRYEIAEEVLQVLEEIQPKILAAFCHGYQFGIQFGIRCPAHHHVTEIDVENWDRFCDALTAHVGNGFTAPVILLYACSTGDDPDGAPDTSPGSGDHSFGDMLRDALCESWVTQCRVLTHTTAGHAWMNRDVKLFDGDGTPDGAVGGVMVAEGSDQRRKLAANLKDTLFAFTFPFWSLDRMRDFLS